MECKNHKLDEIFKKTSNLTLHIYKVRIFAFRDFVLVEIITFDISKTYTTIF